jgi:hypothetical protein
MDKATHRIGCVLNVLKMKHGPTPISKIPINPLRGLQKGLKHINIHIEFKPFRQEILFNLRRI